MNKNERPAFLKGKGAAVGAVLCFVAVITMVGSYTYNHYEKRHGAADQRCANNSRTAYRR